MRPITANEPRPYLQSPTFSTCTVPILFYSTYPHNMYHAFGEKSVSLFVGDAECGLVCPPAPFDLPHLPDLAAEQCTQWHTLLQQTSWRHHVKPVVVTPEGLAMPPAQAALMPVLSPLSPATLADFSSRLPAHGFVPGTAMDGRDGVRRRSTGCSMRATLSPTLRGSVTQSRLTMIPACMFPCQCLPAGCTELRGRRAALFSEHPGMLAEHQKLWRTVL